MLRILTIFASITILLAFQSPTTTWVAIGDSITYLNDHQNETGNRIHKGYMSLVTEKNPHLTYINQGHNGWTTIRIADSIHQLGLVPADLYTIFLGTNDWWQGKPLGTLQNYQDNSGSGTVCGAFRIIVNKLRNLNPKAKIILITPMQRVDFVYINNFKNNAHGSYKPKNGQYLEQFANAIDSIGQLEGLSVIDLYHEKKLALQHLVKFKWLKNPKTGHYQKFKWPDFIDVPFNPSSDEYPYPEKAMGMTYDGLHPSDAGYRVIARKIKIP